MGSGMPVPCLRSVLSKQVESSELGKTCLLKVCLFQSLVGLAGLDLKKIDFEKKV